MPNRANVVPSVAQRSTGVDPGSWSPMNRAQGGFPPWARVRMGVDRQRHFPLHVGHRQIDDFARSIALPGRPAVEAGGANPWGTAPIPSSFNRQGSVEDEST